MVADKSLFIKKLVYSAMCLALALVLPFLTGNIREIGKMLCPMHIPVILCGFLCGHKWGLAVGVTSPLLRSLIFKMPRIYPNAIGMAFELAAYGFLAGFFYKTFPKKMGYTYISLLLAMVIGRVIWGVSQVMLFALDGNAFTFGAFISGAFTSAIPGIIAQIILIPIIVEGLKRTKLTID